jgi:hypothetical protein
MNRGCESDTLVATVVCSRVDFATIKCHLVIPDELYNTRAKITRAITRQGMLILTESPDNAAVNDLRVHVLQNPDDDKLIGMYINMYDGQNWRVLHFEQFEFGSGCCMNINDWEISETFDIREKIERAWVGPVVVTKGGLSN